MAGIEASIGGCLPRRAQRIRQLTQDHGGCVRRDAGDRNQQIVPDLQILILSYRVLYPLIEDAISASSRAITPAIAASAAAVSWPEVRRLVHSTRDAFSASRQIAQLAQGG